MPTRAPRGNLETNILKDGLILLVSERRVLERYGPGGPGQAGGR